MQERLSKSSRYVTGNTCDFRCNSANWTVRFHSARAFNVNSKPWLVQVFIIWNGTLCLKCNINLCGLQLWERNLIAARMIARKPNNMMNMQLHGTYLEANTGSELVRHVPMELSYLNEVSVKVTGSRRLENGLVVPGTFKVPIPSKATKFEWEILRMKELCAHMDISVETLRKIPTLSLNFQTMKLEIVSL